MFYGSKVLRFAAWDVLGAAAWEFEFRREVIAFTSKKPASRDFKFCNQIGDAISSACRNTSEGFGTSETQEPQEPEEPEA
jgi:hypothetical protein